MGPALAVISSALYIAIIFILSVLNVARCCTENDIMIFR